MDDRSEYKYPIVVRSKSRMPILRGRRTLESAYGKQIRERIIHIISSLSEDSENSCRTRRSEDSRTVCYRCPIESSMTVAEICIHAVIILVLLVFLA